MLKPVSELCKGSTLALPERNDRSWRKHYHIQIICQALEYIFETMSNKRLTGAIF
jgi:hypothetical protein